MGLNRKGQKHYLGKILFFCWMGSFLLGNTNIFASSNTGDLSHLIESEPVLTLTLAEAVVRTLDHNLDITVSKHERDVRVTDILFEKAKFDPTVTLSGRYDRSVIPLNRPIFGFGGIGIGNDPDNLDQNDTNVSLGLTQKLPSGADYDLTMEADRNSVAGDNAFLFNPSYTSSLLLNLTQPLLRNYGADVAHVQINIAKNAAWIERYVFVDRVVQTVAQVEEAYWELVFARENADVAKATLRAAKELMASNQAKVKAGVLARVDVLQAQSAVASRVEGVLIAQKGIRDQEDQLRQLFSASEEELRATVVIIPLDRPTALKDLTSPNQAMDNALHQRPEVLQAQKRIESGEFNTQLAKNQLLPSLDFEGSLGLRGLGGGVGDTYDRNFNGDFYNMGAGMVLSYPLGNRSAESQHRRRQLEETQAHASLVNVRQQVIVNVKEALRRVTTNFKRIETTRVARTLAERQLKAEQERLNVGLSTTRAVLDFQGDLAEARGNELRALVDYNQALSNLRRSQATTLDRYGITLE
jgi:outer membrane protein TolC